MALTKCASARLVPAGVMMLFLWAAPVQAATIGNVSSFSTAGQDVTFNIDDGSKVRLSILTPDMVRVRIAPSSTFVTNVSQAVVTTSWPPADFSTSDGAGAVTVTTDEIKLVVNKTPFVLECRDLSDNSIVTDDPTRRIQWDSGHTRVYKTTQVGEDYLGLGWRPSGGVRRNGTRFVMKNVPTYSDPTVFYGGIPIWHGLRNGKDYAILFDDTSWGEINAGAESSDYMWFENTGGQVDYYFFYGPAMSNVLDRYTELTGRPYMPPRWSVGYQQCRWSYTPQSQVLDIANEFRTRNIPCDVIYLDIDYMYKGHALTFDSSEFPDPAGMITTLHGQGFRVVANISPILIIDDPKISAAISAGYMLRESGGSTFFGWHPWWAYVRGDDVGNVAWLDFSQTAARNWWGTQHTSFLNYGIDGIWNDLNEPDELVSTFPTDLKYDFDGSPVNHNKTSTQYPILQCDMSYDILAGHYPDRRPFVLSRGGYAGIQRSASIWSGDNTGDWTNDYQRNIPMGLSMSISGQPHNGHDIGGFFGYPDHNDKPSGELYARWMQSGVFNPFCRQHHDGWGNKDPARPFVEPWEFGTAVENICREFIELRYRLMPYLYTLFHEAHTTGAPVHRPTVYDFQDDPNTITQDYDFMFGPYLLISPVYTEGATTRSVYLPAGADWINWWDDTLYAGGLTVNTAAPLERMPIFVRGGAIIPMAPVSQYAGETPIDVLTLELYPVNEESDFTLYEDDGISWDYQTGQSCRTTYPMSGIGDSFTLDIAARQGSYVPAARDYLLKVHRWPGHTRPAGLNGLEMTEYFTFSAFDAAPDGYYHDTATDILYAKFEDTGGELEFTFGGDLVPNVPGDFNGDGDVDQEDFGRMQACLTGPDEEPSDPDCRDALLDGDNDVDQEDMSLFIGCMSGPNVIGDPDCAP